MSLLARRAYAANLILDDERLRGDLDDAAFAPLQARALDAVDAAACATVDAVDEAEARRRIDVAVAVAKAELRDAARRLR